MCDKEGDGMSKLATTRQKQYLRRLGHKDVQDLTVDQASNLIDQLLEQEKKAGKKFPCPYCGGEFGPRPKRRKKCPHCGKTIYHITGKFYTVEQKDELDQKEWLQERRRDVRQDIRDDWREEKKFRKDGDTFWVGYLVRIGPDCWHGESGDRFGLSERVRAKVYRQLCAAEREAKEELADQYPVERRISMRKAMAQSKKRKAHMAKLRKKYEAELIGEYGITQAQLEAIRTEGGDGLIVLLEDAKAHPEMLPPYDECNHSSCECDYELVTRDEVPRGGRVAELAGDQTTGGRGREKAGCAGLLLFGVAFWVLAAAIGLIT
jgi:hypothetical protein